MERMPLLTLPDIPFRWRHGPNTAPQTVNTVDIVHQPSKHHGEWNYKSCIDKFERYFSAAERSEIIRNISDISLSELHSVEVVQAKCMKLFMSASSSNNNLSLAMHAISKQVTNSPSHALTDLLSR